MTNKYFEGGGFYVVIHLCKRICGRFIGRHKGFVNILILYLIHYCDKNWIFFISYNWNTIFIPKSLSHASKLSSFIFLRQFLIDINGSVFQHIGCAVIFIWGVCIIINYMKLSSTVFILHRILPILWSGFLTIISKICTLSQLRYLSI